MSPNVQVSQATGTGGARGPMVTGQERGSRLVVLVGTELRRAVIDQQERGECAREGNPRVPFSHLDFRRQCGRSQGRVAGGGMGGKPCGHPRPGVTDRDGFHQP